MCSQILALPLFPMDGKISTKKDEETLLPVFHHRQPDILLWICTWMLHDVRKLWWKIFLLYDICEIQGCSFVLELPLLAFLGFFLKAECSWLLLTEYLHQTLTPSTSLSCSSLLPHLHCPSVSSIDPNTAVLSCPPGDAACTHTHTHTHTTVWHKHKKKHGIKQNIHIHVKRMNWTAERLNSSAGACVQAVLDSRVFSQLWGLGCTSSALRTLYEQSPRPPAPSDQHNHWAHSVWSRRTGMMWTCSKHVIWVWNSVCHTYWAHSEIRYCIWENSDLAALSKKGRKIVANKYVHSPWLFILWAFWAVFLHQTPENHQF